MKRRLLGTIAVVLFLFNISTFAQTASVSIDNISGGVWSDGGTLRLSPNDDVHFDIRFINNTGHKVSFNNGFRIWTTGGTPFIPINGEFVYPGFADLFDFGLFGNVYSSDGLGADTLGIAGVNSQDSGLYSGFNDIVIKISTGGIQAGETLCIDSSWFPPTAQWKWASSAGDIFPSWSGQQCFLADCPPCLAPTFTNKIDTLRMSDCEQFSHTFTAETFFIPPTIRFYLVEDPGTIDSMTGEWSYTINPEDLGTIDTLRLGVHGCVSCNFTECWTVLDYTSIITGDINGDCTTDVSDLVNLIAYMFQDGTTPAPLSIADINGDQTVDVSDLVYYVAFMFQNGPPPVG